MAQKAFYTYGISDVNVNENNEEILDVNFGHGKLPLHIFKRDIMDFIKAVLPEEEVEQRQITSEKVNKSLEEDGISVLNYLLGGRAMIIISNFKNYLEYRNGGQNGIEKITGLNIDGRMEMENAFDYKTREPKFEDLYPSKPQNPPEERE